jgi:gliding motility-associated-like protein
MVVTEDVTVYLDANGQALVTANMVNDGSSDNCGISSMTLDVTDFTCEDIGANPVTLTVTDASGNASTGTATVTVIDNTSPTAIGQDVVLDLDSAGEATLTTGMVDFGSFDNCEVVSMSISQTVFTCADLGDSTVAFTVEDGSGHTDTVYVTVTVTATNGSDMDGDGLPDSCDPDDDNDGINDESDNCPETYNPNQEDRDGDGVGDVCDADGSVYVSEALTPNGDGVNDTWSIYGIEQHPNSEVRVYNKWGHEVFFAKGYSNDWNGYYKNQSKPLPDASYYYQIDLDGDGSIEKDGWIYITRL